MSPNLPKGWAWTTLGATANTQLGKMLSAKSRRGIQPRPYLRNQNVQWHRFDLSDVARMDFSDVEAQKYQVRPGDLLVCEGGEVGRCARWLQPAGEMYFQKALHRIRPYRGVETRWLEYFLHWSAETEHFEDHTSGSTIAHLPQRDLRQVVLPLAPVAEQKRIVDAIEDHFSRLDATEAVLRRTITRLDTLRSSIVAEAFHANQEARNGWKFSTVGAIFEVVGGATPRTDNKACWNGDIPWVTPDDLSRHEGIYISRGRRSITKLGHQSTSTHMLPAESVLFSSRAPIGYVAIASNPLCTNQGFKSLVPPSNVDPRFTYWYLRHITPEICEMGSGTTFREISKKRMAGVPFPLVPLQDQVRIASAIEQEFSRVERLESATTAALNKIETVRRSILTTAFSGRLVPQDPDDEPASLLLERIPASRPAKPARRRTRT